MSKILPSELMITNEGAVYHLNLKPENISDKIILVGDPSRVTMIASHFDSIDFDITHREFHSIGGTYKGKHITAMSTGISSDNVDILMTELDALINIDFSTREIKPNLRALDIVRLGTCGALQDSLELGDFILSRYSMGLDGMVNFYADSKKYRFKEIETAYMQHMNWDSELPRPYVVKSSDELSDKFIPFATEGFTACAGGFFAPQGRVVRLKPTVENLVDKTISFEYNGMKVTNFEMEGAAVAAMAHLLGHRATTVCLAVAHRTKKAANTDYDVRMNELIIKTLELI